MPKIIDHDKRKEEILNTALHVFAREGYKDSNLSLIAQECGISRPTIYQYFHDKEEIYYYAVKLVTGNMFRTYADIAWSSEDAVSDKLKEICTDIIDMGFKNRDALTSLVDVMIQLKKEGKDFSDVIMKRTVKLNILFKRLLRVGIERGEIRLVSVNDVTGHLMTLLEAFGFQIAFLDSYDPHSSIELLDIFIDSLIDQR
jgi:TetR/AcrR family transcriptional regulator